MRRPAKTKAQRDHDRQQRALLRLRKVSVRFTVAVDAASDDPLVLTHAADIGSELEAAAFAYTNTLTTREKMRLAKAIPVKW